MVTLTELCCDGCGRSSTPDDFRGWRAYHSEDDQPAAGIHICCPVCARDWARQGSRDEGGLYWPWDLPF